MCGFAGLIDFQRRDDAEALSRHATDMVDALAARGPDDRQVWGGTRRRGSLLGFRRLAVIDLTPAGRQPMVSADGRFVIAYNGEIYNAGDVKPDLRRRAASRFAAPPTPR